MLEASPWSSPGNRGPVGGGVRLITKLSGNGMAHKPLAIDLFSGCGGLTQGLKSAGFRVVAAIELNSKARSIYSDNHPDVWLAGEDIRQTDPSELLRTLKLKPGQLDLVAGCPPCQAFSRIRKRNRLRTASDERNKLIDEFGRFVLTMLPKRIMLENVPGVTDHYRFSKLVSSLERSGYQVKKEVLNVKDYGVPQRRKRLILVGSRDGAPNIAKARNKVISVRAAIGRLPAPGDTGDLLHDLPERRSERIKSLFKAIPIDGGSRVDLPQHMQLTCHQNTDGFRDVYGRMAWDDVAPTITGGCHNPSKGRFIHPSQHRAITLREAAILQGFPARYKFDIVHGKEAIALMIGNALPPPFIAAHARALAKGL
jgi:DNA (cytosine-5)-methyltransferase 1